MLKLENVTFLFDLDRGIQEATFTVNPGEVIGVVGGNGVGKSTLLGLIAAALVPQSGKITLEMVGLGGRVKRFVSDIGIGYRRHVGYLTEAAPVYGELSVKQYLVFRARLHGVGVFRLRRRLTEAMTRCGLVQVAKEPIGKLSLGFQRRVALAEALIITPAVLVLDDPFVGIDAAQRSVMTAIIRNVSARSHVFISGHDPQLLKACCSRFMLVDKGRVVADNLDADTALARLQPAAAQEDATE
jgi:ABC-2 type transport system ATP-binding protein